MGCNCAKSKARPRSAAQRAVASGPSIEPSTEGVVYEVRCADRDVESFPHAADAARVAAELGCGPPVAVAVG